MEGSGIEASMRSTCTMRRQAAVHTLHVTSRAKSVDPEADVGVRFLLSHASCVTLSNHAASGSSSAITMVPTSRGFLQMHE